MRQSAFQPTPDTATVPQSPTWFVAFERGASRKTGFCVVLPGSLLSGATPSSTLSPSGFEVDKKPLVEPRKLPSQWLDPGFEVEDDSFSDLPDSVFEETPQLYLNRAVSRAILNPKGVWGLTEKLLPKLLTKSPARRRLVQRALLAFAKPEDIREIAIAQYRVFGYEERLLTAASLLESFGREAWPTLRQLAASNIPEAYAFVRAVLRLKGVSISERVAALVDLARNPDHDTRERVVEAWEECRSWSGAEQILKALTLSDAGDDLAHYAKMELQEFDRE